jgi:chorismate mutase/prephenate dehydratase
MTQPEELYYLGPITSFHHQAALVYSKGYTQPLSLNAVDSFQQIFEQVMIGNTGIIACKNLISGPIQTNIDYISKAKFQILDKIIIPIDFYLAGINNAEFTTIDTVFGHDQAFIQNSQFLESQLPNSIHIITSSNSRGAEIVAQDQIPRQGALCNLVSIEHFGLQALASEIQNQADNWTEFWVIHK